MAFILPLLSPPSLFLFEFDTVRTTTIILSSDVAMEHGGKLLGWMAGAIYCLTAEAEMAPVCWILTGQASYGEALRRLQLHVSHQSLTLTSSFVWVEDDISLSR
jgi:hypothetical protein